MTLKQHVHELVESLPEDSLLLTEMREALLISKMVEQGLDDVTAGRVYESEAFLTKVQEKWPLRVSV